MTANAFAEDRAACLAAGMNDHISKPVVPQRLYEQLLHWMSRTLPDAPAGAAKAEPEPPPPWTDAEQALMAVLSTLPDLQAHRGLQQFGGRPRLLLHGLRQFVARHAQGLVGVPAEPGPRLPAPRAALCLQLHALLGSASSLGALSLAASAQSLEARLAGTPIDGDEAELSRQLSTLQRQLTDFVDALREGLARFEAEP